ncbi:MAG: transposase [Thiotrichaceae bacterium]|nr:transposase [Thiotrichaceae bacterium]
MEFELSPRPLKQEKVAPRKTGFVPVKARWLIERSNAWAERCKLWIKNFEGGSLENINAKLKLCFIRLMIKRRASF